MNNLKVYENNLKKKVGAIALSLAVGVSSFAVLGCSNVDAATKKVVYKVKKTEEQKNSDKLYDESSDKYNGFNRSKYFGDYREYDHKIDFDGDNLNVRYVYPVGSLKYTTNKNANPEKRTVVSPEFFIEESNLVIPDSMKWFNSYFKDPKSYENNKLLRGNMKLIEYKDMNGERYLYKRSQVKIMNDLDHKYTKEELSYGTDARPKKGDIIRNEVLYKYNKDNSLEVIAYGRAGIGSGFYNEEEAKHRNIYDCFVPVSYIEEESKEFNSEELFIDFVRDNNGKVKRH